MVDGASTLDNLVLYSSAGAVFAALFCWLPSIFQKAAAKLHVAAGFINAGVSCMYFCRWYLSGDAICMMCGFIWIILAAAQLWCYKLQQRIIENAAHLDAIRAEIDGNLPAADGLQQRENEV